jgi:hypothetical protein
VKKTNKSHYLRKKSNYLRKKRKEKEKKWWDTFMEKKLLFYCIGDRSEK